MFHSEITFGSFDNINGLNDWIPLSQETVQYMVKVFPNFVTLVDIRSFIVSPSNNSHVEILTPVPQNIAIFGN